jgi:hypothetical protein
MVLPPSASLTLIELDERLTTHLRTSAPHATVIQGDALDIIRDIPCDVLLSNLPRAATRDLIELLPELSFRTAIIAMGEDQVFTQVGQHFTSTVVTTAEGGDFRPPQPARSLLVKLSRLDDPPLEPFPASDRLV